MVEFWWQFSDKFPRKIWLNICHQKLHHILHCKHRAETKGQFLPGVVFAKGCEFLLVSPNASPHSSLELTLGASLPKIWRCYIAFGFVMERQVSSPRFSFAFALVMIMLGTQKP